MNNRERISQSDSYHVMVALRRKKDPGNRELKELCFRDIVYTSEMVSINVLKARIDNKPGIWRIYRTVNKRSVREATKLMFKQYIDEPEKFEWKIPSLWKNCLLKKENKAERNFLLDIDCDWNRSLVDWFIERYKLEVIEIIKTPNGYHIIIPASDTRDFSELPNIEIKRNDLKFIEIFSIKGKLKGFEEKCICDWSKNDEYGFIPSVLCPVHGEKIKKILEKTVEINI